jgi:NAD(P)H-hydrate epimerase
VDIPSGINADTGTCEANAINAAYTFTLELPKFGLYLSPGREQAGIIQVIPIGIPEKVVSQFGIYSHVLTKETASSLLPKRKPDGHKGDFGKLLVIAGSTGMAGAAALTGKSALRTGCGLVKIACPHTVLPTIASLAAEVTTHPLPDVAKKGAIALRALGEILELAKTHDAVALGPGLGQHHETRELVKRLVSRIDKPLIIDADGLNALKDSTNILKERKGSTILTPHPGEFERLTGEQAMPDYQTRIQQVQKYAKEWNVVLVLKGSPTLVGEPSGIVYLNPTGNSGMAKGGSGDVLTGIIASLVVQGCSTIDAARLGVYLHGLAGDITATQKTQRAMIAGDIIESLPSAFQTLEK